MATQSVVKQELAPNESYVWQVPGKRISVHIRFDLIERFNQQFRRASVEFKGGILLGRSIAGPHTVVVIDGYEPVPSGDDFQSSLATVAQKFTTDRVRNDPGARRSVGFFRSQNAGWLSLTEQDQEIAKQLFCNADDVVLLIRFTENSEGTAGFFIWENGSIQGNRSYHEFPLDGARLLQADRATKPLLPAPREEARQAEPRPARGSSRLLTGLVWLLGVIIAAAAAITVAVVLRSSGDHHAGGPAADIRATDTTPLGLRVASAGPQLNIFWNHESPVILTATRATLTITDGDLPKRIDMDQAELRDGSLAYTPSSTDVRIRLEANGADGKTTGESIRVIIGNAGAYPLNENASRSLALSARDLAALESAGTSIDKKRVVQKPVEPVARPVAAGEGAPEATAQSGAPSKIAVFHLPSEQRNSLPKLSIEAPPAIVQPAPARPVVAVAIPIATAPPPAPPKKQSSAPAPAVVEEPVVEEPKVLRRVLPVMTQGDFAGSDPVEIVVTAQIDKRGHVSHVSLAPATAPARGRLDAEAMAAAQKWMFQPATVNGQAVPSQMQIRFRFSADGVHP